jgi:hypothetical protein
MEKWWNSELQGLPRQTRRVKAAVMMHTAWAIWMERNRRIFEGRSVQPVQVFRFIKDEMALSARATGGVVQLNFYD